MDQAWLGPWPELAAFEKLGVAGAIFIADACFRELQGNYSPHTGRPQPLSP